ncbi:hypothetical protein IQ235_03130 [Oscillatoriales cyanobacterium LEGE 11467]|uniref:Calx-beta domain-containing protein n=1 Tax=Zarconia navalis LEGE 11467 TaxID=1828826 RepID=A0A928VTC3_9CYAN|nr:Calx-beta domain-containing protein [Zarconia navalis]MBE9039786.1 hypothetical protein [Zarconia navalis LEGE 11467]
MANLTIWDFESGNIIPIFDVNGGAIANTGLGINNVAFPSDNGGQVWRAKAWSTGAFDANDYFEFKADLTGHQNITFDFEERQQNADGITFELQYSVGGGAFTPVGAAITPTADGQWHAHNFTFGAALDNQANVAFRLFGYNFGTGNWKVDNVTIAGNLLTSSMAIAPTAAGGPEGNAGNTPYTFTIARTDTTTASSVDWTVAGTGANPVDAADFGGALPFGTVNFAIGQASQVVTVNASGDATIEPNEDFNVTLSAPANGENLAAAVAMGTIQNDDTTPGGGTTPTIALSSASATQMEGDTGTTPYSFTITRSGSTTGTTNVDWTVAGSGTNPADAADFGGTLPGGTVSFAPGETNKVITFNVSSDTTVEADEDFTVTLSDSSLGTVYTSGTGTIQNDDSTSGGGSGTPTHSCPTFGVFPGPATTIETLFGDNTNNTIVSSANASTALGLNGNDTLFGLGGTDNLFGNRGQDILYGNINDDYLDGGQDEDWVLGGKGNDVIRGGFDDDTLAGQIGNDRIEGNEGNDVIFGNVGFDSIHGNTGNDSIYAGQDDDVAKGNAGRDTLIGDLGNDCLDGGADADLLFGNNGNDCLLGDSGNDLLYGGRDDDSLTGGLGNDILKGDIGNDLLTGSTGGDRFDFRTGDGNDIITDFQDGADIIGLSGGLTFAAVSITQVGVDTQLSASGLSVTLQGINASTISSADFALV